MKLLQEENIILLSVRELVSTARRRISPSLPLDENEPEKSAPSRAIRAAEGLTDPERLSIDHSVGNLNFRIEGYADSVKDNKITLIKSCTVRTSAQKKAEMADARGEGFILSHILSERLGEDITLEIIYVSEESGEREDSEETISRERLAKFFSKCANTMPEYAAPEIERITKRLPSLRAARFPYQDVRSGQEEFMKRVYRTLVKGGTIFSCAPTGTGKTVSVIYPAVKALGEQKCDKVFYLTPKTTTAEAARECIDLMAKKGANLRSIILTSKEKSCQRRLICRDGVSVCDMAAMNKLAEAVSAVYKMNKPVIDINDIKEAANLYTVCPYELELSYSELCDIVIGDFNYLFDPVVYIRRFFTEGGRYAFLIDEAHNLADRAREMYSAELSPEDIDALLAREELGTLSKLREQLPKLKERLIKCAMSYLKDEIIKTDTGEERGAAHLSNIPPELYEITDELLSALEDEERITLKSKDNEKGIRLKIIRDLFYKVKKLSSALASFDTGYRLFLFYTSGGLSLKVYCIDTGRELQQRLSKGVSAVFFSATLTPTEYYRSVLSDDRYADAVEIDSPFDSSQLSVSIMDKISTRYSEREKTLPAISRVIAATMAAKRGHYMVFAPSFEYAEELHREFSAKYPKIKCLLQQKNMTAEEKGAFLSRFSAVTGDYLLGFCVMGGIYSEGIDLAGDSLIGAVVVGIGMPSLSYEREAIAEYFEDKYESGKQYAYIYPGMNRVFQAAGRVIRREDDRGVIVLIDDRFQDPIYKKSIPSLWEGMKYIGDAKELKARLDKFWAENS